MSETNSNGKPKNHGEIKIEAGEPKRGPFIPIFLRKMNGVDLRIDHNLAVSKYGLFELKARREVMIYGVLVREGDTFKVPGNEAIFLAYDGDAEFTNQADAREEAELIERAKKLHLPSVRKMAEFAA